MPLIIIRGAGDIASGIALRLHRSGYSIIMTDLPAPTSIRRTVCFSEALRLGLCTVEDVTAVRADGTENALSLAERGKSPFWQTRRAGVFINCVPPLWWTPFSRSGI